jgi:hypothetical protein
MEGNLINIDWSTCDLKFLSSLKESEKIKQEENFKKIFGSPIIDDIPLFLLYIKSSQNQKKRRKKSFKSMFHFSNSKESNVIEELKFK